MGFHKLVVGKLLLHFDHLKAFSHDVDVIFLPLLNGAWLTPHMVSTSLFIDFLLVKDAVFVKSVSTSE